MDGIGPNMEFKEMIGKPGKSGLIMLASTLLYFLLVNNQERILI